MQNMSGKSLMGQDRVPGSALRQRRYPISSTPSSSFPTDASMPCIRSCSPPAPARNGHDRDQHGRPSRRLRPRASQRTRLAFSSDLSCTEPNLQPRI